MTTEERAVKYLVTEADGTTHLPYTDADGKPDHRLMGAAWAATHSGYRGKKYAGPDKDKAIEKLTAVYKSEKMDTPEEKNSAPADETRMPFTCPACGYVGDTDEMNAAPKFDERRATVARIGRQFRSLPKDIVRMLSQETQDGIALIQQCRAASYAVLSYICYMPYDAFPDDFYGIVYECSMCCDVCVSLAGRESALSSAAHELCAAACREAVTACSGTNDAMVQGFANHCMKTATACDAMGAAGETEDGRAARNNQDIVRSCKFETRASSDGHIKGYPILFNELSQDLGGFRERILPDAVHLSDDVRCDFNHNPDYILGRSTAGTLTLTTDDRGVLIDADPPDTTWARDLKVSMDRGDINQGSFAFRILPGGQTISVTDDGQQIRTLTNILVRKVSIVADPAYLGTRLEVRSAAQTTPTEVPAPAAAAVEPPAAAAALPAPKLSTIHLRRKLELEAAAT